MTGLWPEGCGGGFAAVFSPAPRKGHRHVAEEQRQSFRCSSALSGSSFLGNEPDISSCTDVQMLSDSLKSPLCWHSCVSSRQETVRIWFPIRHDDAVFHRGRKLFAYSFLSDMVPSYFITAGNCLRIVSCPTWHHRVSSQQETVRIWFPIRHDAIVFHRGRKLFPHFFHQFLYFIQRAGEGALHDVFSAAAAVEAGVPFFE